jgi:hypothetical protein
VKRNATVEYWNINFDNDTARFSIEDDTENASIVVDVLIHLEPERHKCSVKRIIDCWCVSDYDNKVNRTSISNEEIETISEILQNEYLKYLGK